MNDAILGFLIGTRPEAIKMAPVILEAQRRGHNVLVISSGQHDVLVRATLNVFGIIPDETLLLERSTGSIEVTLSSLIPAITDELKLRRVSHLFVHGDTATTFAGALSAFLLKVPVFHVEAGLRTGLKSQPFPEEAFRRMVAVLADFHYAPTALSGENLRRENVDPRDILVAGNSIVDAVHLMVEPVQNVKKLVVVTAHRRENWALLGNIADAVGLLSLDLPEFDFILPLHPNPDVRQAFQGLTGRNNIQIVEPMNYADFLNLIASATLLITDSGGIQEEAVTLGVPCLITRTSTERPEVLEGSSIQLVGTNVDQIVNSAKSILKDHASGVRGRGNPRNPVGDGLAAVRILDDFESRLTS